MSKKFPILFSLVAGLVILFSFPAWASATTYYVSLAGSDSNNATQAQSSTTPWKTIEYAIENGSVHFGDTIILGAGTYYRDNLWKSGGNNNIRSSYNITLGSGTITIMSEVGQRAIIDIPTSTITTLFQLQGDFLFKDIDFTNSSATAVYLLNINDQNDRATNVTFQNCTFNDNNAGGLGVIGIGTGVTNFDVHLNIVGSKVKNVSSTKNFIRSAIDPTNKTRVAYVNIISSLFRDMSTIVYTSTPGPYTNSNGPINLTFINNTVANLKNSTSFSGLNASSTAKIENNIFRADSIFTSPIYIYNVRTSDMGDNWIVKNNVFYRAITADPGTEVDRMLFAQNELLIPDQSNFYFNPQFINEAGDNYAIASTSYANGRGLASDLPATDINGNSWSGGHIGAYPNEQLNPIYPTLLVNQVAFVGDSISEGAGNKLGVDGRLSVVGDGILGAAIGSSNLSALPHFIDRAATTWAPKTIFIISANNSFAGAANSPASTTYSQATSFIEMAMKKAEYWGMTPIWLGMGGVQGADPITKPTTLNNAVQEMCTIEGYSCGSFLSFMRVLNQDWNLAADSGGYYLTGAWLQTYIPRAMVMMLLSNLLSISITPSIPLLIPPFNTLVISRYIKMGNIVILLPPQVLAPLILLLPQRAVMVLVITQTTLI